MTLFIVEYLDYRNNNLNDQIIKISESVYL